MRVERGASQILFGLLPGQTADLEGRVWRVDDWVDPVPLALDPDGVRSALLNALAPWTQRGTDDGLAADLRARAPVDVVKLNVDRGVRVHSFPRQWRCKACGRLEHSLDGPCQCGARSWAQMQFVAYHSCGAAREPFIPSCHDHRAVGVRLPGTATARELLFFCPVCRATVSRGFPFQACTCGAGGMNITVHRAGAVFSPRFAVVVNPPDPATASALRTAGGGARAMDWVLDGMPSTLPTEGRQTLASLVETFRRAGLSEESAQEFARQAAERGEIDSSGPPLVVLPNHLRDRAHEEALSLASAAAGGRLRVVDMIQGTTPPQRTLYEGAYKDSIHAAGFTTVELLSNFPVATLAFGYTRGDMSPGATRLVPFRERGRIRVYGSLSRTEALLFQLDPLSVHRHLTRLGHALPATVDARQARLSLLNSWLFRNCCGFIG